MASLTPEDARGRFLSGAVARLATVTRAGHPHLVPVTFAPDGPDRLLTAVDHKPKRTRELARLDHIAANPHVSLLVDVYAEDWSTLWWARADGLARVLRAESHARAREAAAQRLAERYPQYADIPPAGPVIEITVERWIGWSAAEG